jgi:methionyl aminopeptidase
MAILLDEESKEYYIKAGQIAGRALNYGAKLAKPGMDVRELLNKIEEKIAELGGNLAFPPQASINTFAAHCCPTEDDGIIIKEEDMIKIDVGAEYEGFIGDTALTVYLGNDPEKKKLVESSKVALMEAIKLCAPGIKVGEIGKRIEETITSFGFKPVKNLSGHGLGVYEFHDAPSIPNFDNGDASVLEENEMIAIEPFATDGYGLIKGSGVATVFNKVQDKGTRNIFAREAIKIIDKLEGLPFSTTFLENKMGKVKAKHAIKELVDIEVLQPHSPLEERAGGLVSQHEHSLLVGKEIIITTMVDDE